MGSKVEEVAADLPAGMDLIAEVELAAGRSSIYHLGV
jgi:hypothetical protein